MGLRRAHFGAHEAGPRRANALRRDSARIAQTPGRCEGMTGEEADPFLDIAEAFGRLSLAAPSDFAGIYIHGPEGNGG